MKIFPPPAVVSTKLTIVLKAIATLKSHSHTHIFKIASIQLCNVRQFLVTQHAFGTSMIVNFSKPSIREVLEEERGIQPDSSTYAGMLQGCIDRKTVVGGKLVHAHMIKTGFEIDPFLGNTLVNMYAKCGTVGIARQVFEKMPELNAVSWNAMIAGYAQNEHGEEAWKLYCQMQRAGMELNQFTFASVLKACASIVALEEGKQVHVHIIKTGFHLDVFVGSALVDMYAKCRSLDDACHVFDKMPERNVVSWNAMIAGNAQNGNNEDALKLFCQMQQAGMIPSQFTFASVLSACASHEALEQMELGKQAAERLLELDPQNSATYVLLSNIYAEAGRWEDVAKVRTMMKDKGVKKDPGCSWIEVKNRVHTFIIEDRSHPQVEQIYAKLEELIGQIEEAGFVPKTNFVLHDTQQQKQHPVCFHSEMLAIAFGLINTLPGTPIRVIKNLRVCLNCHTATKFISKTVGREIIVRDASRFHHFRDWLCSCGDFW